MGDVVFGEDADDAAAVHHEGAAGVGVRHRHDAVADGGTGVEHDLGGQLHVLQRGLLEVFDDVGHGLLPLLGVTRG